MKIRCGYCGRLREKPASAVNRARFERRPMYCDLKCFGLARRSDKTKAQRVAEKAVYDHEYRKRNLDWITAKKRAYFARTYDPFLARNERQKHMARHVECCRRPEYKLWKRDYDKQYRAKEFGPFAAAYVACLELTREIRQRITDYEKRLQNGTLNKKLARAGAALRADRRAHRRDHAAP